MSLRFENKKNSQTKNFVEYKASQIVRNQDRIRQQTLSSHYKQFSKLAKDVDRTIRTAQTSPARLSSPARSRSRSRRSLSRDRNAQAIVSSANNDVAKTFEQIIE